MADGGTCVGGDVAAGALPADCAAGVVLSGLGAVADPHPATPKVRDVRSTAAAADAVRRPRRLLVVTMGMDRRYFAASVFLRFMANAAPAASTKAPPPANQATSGDVDALAGAACVVTPVPGAPPGMAAIWERAKVPHKAGDVAAKGRVGTKSLLAACPAADKVAGSKP